MARPRLPLRAISVFETVARRGTFKAAADELHLTPSAVSHQIRALEDELGVGLFLRESRGVKLAPAGSEYAERLHDLLDGVRTAKIRKIGPVPQPGRRVVETKRRRNPPRRRE